MRRLVTLAIGGVAIATSAGPQPSSVLALTGGRMLDVAAGRYRPVGALVIRHDRIEALLDSPQGLSSAARRIDVAGATIVPGLGDLEARGGPIGDLDADYFSALSLAHGVTFGRVVDVRLPWGVSQRARIRAGDVLAPRIWISGPGLEQRVDAEGHPQPRAPRAPGATVEVADAAGAAREIEAQARAGVDWIAVHGNVAPDLVKPIVISARAARLKVSAAAGSASMLQLVQAGIDLIDLAVSPLRPRQEYERAYVARPDVPRDPAGFDDYVWEQTTRADRRTLAAALVRARVAIAPMLARGHGRAAPDSALADPMLELLPASRRERLKAELTSGPAGRAGAALEAQNDFIAEVQRAGALIVAGTGTDEGGYPVPGAGLHAELRALVAAGLPSIEALRAATTRAAAVVGEASVGQIKQGVYADLLVVDGDPLQRIDDLARIRLVVFGGEVLDRGELLRQAARATRIVK